MFLFWFNLALERVIIVACGIDDDDGDDDCDDNELSCLCTWIILRTLLCTH